MENRHTQQRRLNNQNNTYKVTKVNEQLGLQQKLGALPRCTGAVSVLCFSRKSNRVANKKSSPVDEKWKENYDILKKIGFYGYTVTIHEFMMTISL